MIDASEMRCETLKMMTRHIKDREIIDVMYLSVPHDTSRNPRLNRLKPGIHIIYYVFSCVY